MPARRLDVVALGEAMVEFNQTRPGRAVYRQGFGGDTSNCAIASARAGARAAYLTRVGDDAFGAALRTLWAREHVDATGVESDPLAPTGIYFVTHGIDGHAFTYRRAGSAASHMTPEWLHRHAAPIVRDAQWLHVSGISLAISREARDTTLEAMRIAREAGTHVSFDSNVRLKLWTIEQAREGLTQAMGLCDLFLPGMEDIGALTGLTRAEEVLDWCRARCRAQIVLKMGADGALIDDGSNRRLVPGRRVTAVDATGAGDCFCGNLLARLSAGDDLVAATRWANVAAALAVQRWGAVESLPTAVRVRRALRAA